MSIRRIVLALLVALSLALSAFPASADPRGSGAQPNNITWETSANITWE